MTLRTTPGPAVRPGSEHLGAAAASCVLTPRTAFRRERITPDQSGPRKSLKWPVRRQDVILMPQQSWVARLGLESPGRRGAGGLAGGPSASSCALPSAFPGCGSDPAAGPRPHQARLCLPSRCVLGNTTILAEFASEEEISRFFAQSQSLTPSPSWQSLGSSQSRLGSLDCSHSFSSRTDLNHWNGAGLSGANCGDLHGTSLWGTPHYSTSLWGPPSSSDPRGISSPSPINAFLSVDHLGGGGESI